MQLSIQYHEGNRAHSNQVPKFLQNKPHKMVANIMQKWQNCDIPVDDIDIISHCHGEFRVKSSTGTGQQYTVRYGDETNLPHCLCYDWRHHRLPCKHFCACMKAFPEWGWDKLGLAYTANPLFSLDEDIMGKLNHYDDDYSADHCQRNPSAPESSQENNTTVPGELEDNSESEFKCLPPKHTYGK